MATMDATLMLRTWKQLSRLPGGKRLFSGFIGRMAPYTGTLPFRVDVLAPGHAVVRLYDRRIARNHLNSLHAIALMNLGEVATGLAMYAGLPAGGRGIITNLSMAYHKKARGTITATCDVDVPSAPGKHDLLVQAKLVDQAGELVAEATATWRLDVR